MPHTRKRIRKLSTAVFRGSKTEYNFDVFPISPSITDSAAVFIFSHRSVDKKGRAHHTVSCVGETPSLVSEIKRHRRSRCVKDNQANVICVLKESNPGVRCEVVDDIATARIFSCVRGSLKPRVKRVADTREPKILKFKPAQKVKRPRAVPDSASVPSHQPIDTNGRSPGAKRGTSSDTGVRRQRPLKQKQPAGRTKRSGLGRDLRSRKRRAA